MDDFKGILISVKPRWCELIASGIKTIEVRKTKPKIDTPFKCYIYETKTKDYYSVFHETTMGKVVGEFVCEDILEFEENLYGEFSMYDDELQNTCLTQFDLVKYSGGRTKLYGWEISNFKKYDKPKELSEFYIEDKASIKQCKHRFRTGQPERVTQHGGWLKGGWGCIKDGYTTWCENCLSKPLASPPQSWCYAKEAYNG